MRIISKAGVLIINLIVFGFSAQAQIEGLFAPYDCRRHAEVMVEPVIDTLSSISLQALNPVQPELDIIIDTLNGWKDWRFVQNFQYGKDRGDMPMIVEVNALHPYFRDQIITLIANCKQQGIDLAVVESYRTHAKQSEYKGMGKKYTRSGAGKSKHQYGLAVDLVPIVDSVAVWDDKILWKRIGVVGEQLGLRWGGRWKKPYDPGHFEWTGGVPTSQLSVGKLPPIVNQEQNYPCIEDDIKLLQRYWKEWEINQSSMARK